MFDVVINPAAASGRVKKVWLRTIEPIFQAANVDYNVHFSTLEYNIPEIMRDLTSTQEKRNIIVVGGDGTMNLAVNGIVDFENTRIGYIPCGSANDLAKGLHISKDLETCAKQILQGKVHRCMDVGEVVYLNQENILQKEETSEDGYVHHRFNISSGIGFDAHICEEAQISKAKKVLNKIYLGKLVYIMTAIRIIASTKRIPSTMIVDGKEYAFPALLFSVCMNTKYEGGGFQFCPHAESDDGLLDVCVGNHLSQFDFFRIFPYAYSGNHLKFKGVTEMKAREIEIKVEKPMWVHTDGEVNCQSTHIQIHLLKEKLQMLN